MNHEHHKNIRKLNINLSKKQNPRILCAKNENNENTRNPYENNENHKNNRNQHQNHENHEKKQIEIQMTFIKIMKIITFHMRIIKL